MRSLTVPLKKKSVNFYVFFFSCIKMRRINWKNTVIGKKGNCVHSQNKNKNEKNQNKTKPKPRGGSHSKYKHKGEPTIVELKSVYPIDWINVKRIHDRINLSLNAHRSALQLSHKYWITKRRLERWQKETKKRIFCSHLEKQAIERGRQIEEKKSINFSFDIAKMCMCKVWENYASNNNKQISTEIVQ